MKVVGLTGGIGSGKTTVAKMFKGLGVPVYNADTEAKILMNQSSYIKGKLIEYFSEKAYNAEGLDREFIASKVFNDKNALDYINSIVHPEVAKHFDKWLDEHNAPYIIKEAAIIFEHNMQSQYDYTILVIADKQLRIARILERDNTSKEKILAIMNNQLSDAEKIIKADFVIDNNDFETTQKQVDEIHKILSEIA